MKNKPVNNIKAGNRQKQHTKSARTSYNTFGRMLHNLLDGSFLNQDKISSWLPFIIFITMLGLFYISNNHLTEKKTRELKKLDRELVKLRFESLRMKTKLNEKTHSTYLANDLEKNGIKRLVEPPEKIFIKKQTMKNE